MIRFLMLGTAAALLLSAPVRADEITDTLNGAIEAYEAGDVQCAIEELDYARQKLMEMKTEALGGYLPPAPEGWSREIGTEANAGLAMMGGGVGAEAEYVSPEGESYSLTLMADNPMVASMAPMIMNASAMGLKMERIARQKFAVQDGQLMGLVANRILVQLEGPDLDTGKSLLETMDFDALAAFGS
ncbi:hypothetical protein [Salipiger mucosus]|uniref:Uncharacterized protein n=1 Tax=Salipiger mucosus DSM 16094 TaxID=1123237 RepID=S9QNT9_9RHOB|nr:hypothetical protein [Salipiger mucosus]EPX83081.1 hypothetical protein Salmuc_02879 [Salipiger mucosus DSM 16094]